MKATQSKGSGGNSANTSAKSSFVGKQDASVRMSQAHTGGLVKGQTSLMSFRSKRGRKGMTGKDSKASKEDKDKIVWLTINGVKTNVTPHRCGSFWQQAHRCVTRALLSLASAASLQGGSNVALQRFTDSRCLRRLYKEDAAALSSGSKQVGGSQLGSQLTSQLASQITPNASYQASQSGVANMSRLSVNVRLVHGHDNG